MTTEELLKPRYNPKRTNNYFNVHYWLIKKYGKATKCESLECKNKSQNFEWALIRGCDYIKDVSKFIQLCTSCHRLYDMTEEKIKNQSLSQQKRSKETRNISGLMYNKKGLNNFSAKKVIDMANGIIYETLRQAANENNIKEAYLCGMLKGHFKNKTTLQYYDTN